MTCVTPSEEQTLPNNIYLTDYSSNFYEKMTARTASELFGVQLSKVQEGLIDTVFHFSLFETGHTQQKPLLNKSNWFGFTQ